MNKKPALLSELESAHYDVITAKGRVTLAVLEARKAGLSWSEIADKLEISKQAAAQRYGEYCRTEIEAQAAFDAREKSVIIPIITAVPAQPRTTLVDEDRAGHSITPSIFLEPQLPAKLEKLPTYTNPHGWAPNTWMQDDPSHFLEMHAPMSDRKANCTFCGQKHHKEGIGGTWLYPACKPTTNDPAYVQDYEN